MKREDEIDKIFKKGIPASSFENLPAGRQGKDALWQRIEKDLDKEPKKKRPLVYLAVLLCLVAGSIFFIKNSNSKKQIASPVAKTEIIKSKPTGAIAQNKITDGVIDNKVATNQIDEEKKSTANRVETVSKKTSAKIIIQATSADYNYVFQNEAKEEELLPERNSLMPEQITFSLKHTPGLKIQNINASPPVKHSSINKPSKYSVDLMGGVTIASFKKAAGFYAGIAVNKHLKNNAAVSAALIYSASNLSQKYKLSSKPDYNKETDAILNKLNMLQVSVQLRQQVKGSKLFLSAGLMPVYVLDASFVNMPISDSSNPALYRRFTINDVNRLNVLFTTGARYKISPLLHAEINGTYGLTGLVKDSYINQSNLKGNFRSVQVGLVYSLR